MKSYFPFLILLLAACTSPTDPKNQQKQARSNPKNLNIDFQTGFHEDTLVLYHGAEKIYEKVLTTAEGQALTDQFSIPREEIKDSIRFTLRAEGQLLEGYIPLKKDAYVGFYLTSGTAVNVYSKSTPFEYPEE